MESSNLKGNSLSGNTSKDENKHDLAQEFDSITNIGLKRSTVCANLINFKHIS